MNNQRRTFPKLTEIADNSATTHFEADVQLVPAGQLAGVDIDGVFHCQAPLYMNSEHGETESVWMHFRTARDNVTALEVIVKDYVAPPKSAGKRPDGEHESTGTAEQEAPPPPEAPETVIAMHKLPAEQPDDRYDLWEAVLPPSTITRQYLFRLQAGEQAVYYDVDGLTEEKRTDVKNWFRIAPGGTSTPEWAKNTVYYSVMVDSFFNGDVENDPTQAKCSAAPVLWGTERRVGHEWYGGDLEGLEQKLSYIQDTLGADSVYTNPTFDTAHNAGYGQYDYHTIQEFLGTNQKYADMLRAAHERGIHVLNDGVWLYIMWHQHRFTNLDGKHAGIGNFQAEDSKYREFVDWEVWGEKWRALYYNYPSVNFDSQFTRNIMIHHPDSALQYFLREPYNLDGWRLDVPSFGGNVYTEDEIVAMMKREMRAISKDKILIGEYGSDAAMAAGDYDCIWYYGDVPSSLRAYLSQKQGGADLWSPYGAEKPQTEEELLSFFRRQTNYLPWQNSAVAYTLLSTHDTTRIGDALDGDESKLERAVAMQMTVMGSPCIYYGDEIGMRTHIDGLAGYYRMNGFDWDKSHWNWKLFNTHRSLIALRRAYDEVYRHGAFKGLMADNHSHTLAYGRFVRDQGAVTLINSDTASEHVVELPLYDLGVPDGTVVYDWENGYRYVVENGIVSARVLAGSYAVLVWGGPKPNGGYTGAHLECQPVGRPLDNGYVSPEPDTAQWRVTGFGSIGGTHDTLQYVGHGVTGNAAVTVRLSALCDLAGADAAGLTLRSSLAQDAACCLLTAGEAGISFRYRTFDGEPMQNGKQLPTTEAVWLRLERNGNRCVASVAPDENGAAGAWTVLDEAYVDLRAEARVGLAVAGEKGATVLAQELEIVSLPTLRADDFRQNVPGGIWAQMPDRRCYQLTPEGLKLTGYREKCALSTVPVTGDWSVRTTLCAPLGEGDEVGIESRSTDRQCARLKRVCRGGQYWLVCETESAGLVRERACMPDSRPDAPVSLQLQKIGGYMNALVREQDAPWKYLGEPFWYNVAECANGPYLKTEGILTVTFDSFTFGAELDGVAGDVDVPVNYTGDLRLCPADRAADEQYRYGAGDWEYADAGYIQQNASGRGDLRINKVYRGDYRLSVCVEQKGKGAAGVAFGVPDAADGHDAGCKILLCADGRVVLSENGRLLASESPMGLDVRRELALNIFVEGATVKVYTNGRLLLSYSGITATEGAVRLLTENTVATFRNYTVSEYTTLGLYNVHSGDFSTAPNGIRSQEHSLALAALPFGVKDFSLQTTLTLLPPTPPAEGQEPKQPGGAGIAFFGQVGQDPQQCGHCLYVQVGELLWLENGVERARVALDGVKEETPLRLELVVSGGILKVRADGCPVMEGALGTSFSGGLAFMSNARQALFEHIAINN